MIEEENDLDKLEKCNDSNQFEKEQLYQDVQHLSQQFLQVKQENNRYLQEMPDTDTSCLSKQAKELKEVVCAMEKELAELRAANDSLQCQLEEDYNICCNTDSTCESIQTCFDSQENDAEMLAMLESKRTKLEYDYCVETESNEMAAKLVRKSKNSLENMKNNNANDQEGKHIQQKERSELKEKLTDVECKVTYLLEKTQEFLAVKGELTKNIKSLDSNFLAYKERCTTMSQELVDLHTRKLQLTSNENMCATCANPINVHADCFNTSSSSAEALC